MTAKMKHSLLAVWVLLSLASASWDVFAGPKASGETGTGSSDAVSGDSSMQLSGEELWSNNCQRCHNMRSPAMYNQAQWNVIVHHMRVRANVTGGEQRAIADFLRSASPR